MTDSNQSVYWKVPDMEDIDIYKSLMILKVRLNKSQSELVRIILLCFGRNGRKGNTAFSF